MADTLPKITVTPQDWSVERGANSPDTPSTTDTAFVSGTPKSPWSPDGTSTRANGKKSPLRMMRNTSNSTSAISNNTSPTSHTPPRRVDTDKTISRSSGFASSDAASNDVGIPGTEELAASGGPAVSAPVGNELNMTKEKKKASLLSRFSMIGSKKKDRDGTDDESEHGDKRTEGVNAHVFSSSIDASGFIPQHKEPPRYIKVRAIHKNNREFNRMFLAQELRGSALPHERSADAPAVPPPSPAKSGKPGSAVWAIEFSKDGKYLAAAGRDKIVRVWAVISTPDERRSHEDEEDASVRSGFHGGERLSAPVFRSKPIREFDGHASDVLDLAWSKNNFLLSSSMDKTVKLWHVSRQECLCTFKHKDFVTSIAFHPRDDRFFLAGSLDSTLRLWSIPDKSVAYSQHLSDLITAVAFTPDGKFALAGVMGGMCHHFDTEGLKPISQIHVRSSRGKNAKGSKITGIQAIVYPPDDPDAEVKLLITSNDSRIRLYNLRDKTLEMKFKGHENTSSQIRASFNDDARYVTCGSEDRKTFIWSTGPSETDGKDKRPVEVFEAHSDIVTTGIFAPTKTKQLLSASGDPVYDLCNPPPVTLLSREESVVAKPELEKRHSDAPSEPRKPEESPAYLARTQHPDGNIIITADHTGNIKVFRQDCAFQKRRNEIWEVGSTFSKKLGGSVLGRSTSILTRHSGGSRRDSVSQLSHLGHGPSDRILSWRNAVPSTTSIDHPPSGGPSRHERSMSPTKVERSGSGGVAQGSSNVSSQSNLHSTPRSPPRGRAAAPTSPPSLPTSPPPSVDAVPAPGVTQPPTPGFRLNVSYDENPLQLDPAGKSYRFWNVQEWKNQFVGGGGGGGRDSKSSSARNSTALDESHLMPYRTRNSVVSRLSSEELSDEVNSDEDVLVCKRCQGNNFRAKKVAGKGQRLVCTRCGLEAG